MYEKNLNKIGDIFVTSRPPPPLTSEEGDIYLSTDGKQRWEYTGGRWVRDWTHEEPDKLPGWFVAMMVFAAIVGLATLSSVFGQLFGR
jgi:hypothetical protein